MSGTSQQHHNDSHVDYGKLSITEYILLAYSILQLFVFELPRYLISRPWHPQRPSERPLSTSIKHFLMRTTSQLLTPRQNRILIAPSSKISIFSSPRYKSTSHNLYQQISRPEFTGYWIVRSSFTSPQAPQHSDITLYFLHGGGYTFSRVETYLLFLLRLAEAIQSQGLSVSIFALDYHLAPEHAYPTQLEEAVAGYEYLIQELGIPIEKVIIAGDSAGGHLTLSLLVSLQRQQQSKPLRKPGGAILLSPWLSLHHTPRTNADTDIISATFLRATARHFLGAAADSEEIKTDPLLEFLHPLPETDWVAVLPSRVWVSAGTNEVMFDDIIAWTQALEQKLGRKRVTWEWGAGEVHDWQWLSTLDEEAKKEFLQKEGGKNCEDFSAVVSVGKVVASMVDLASHT